MRANENGIGRSSRLPTPWASSVPAPVTPRVRSSHLQLEQQQAALVRLHLENPRLVGGEVDGRRLTGGDLALDVVPVHVNLVVHVAAHQDPHRAALRHLDPMGLG